MEQRCYEAFLYRVLPFFFIFLLFSIQCAAQEPLETQKSKVIYLSSAEYPKKIYSNQIFGLKVRLTIALEEFTNLKTSFEQNGVKVINRDAPWRRIDTNSFENSYYLKALDSPFRLPDITIEVTLPEGTIEREIFSFETLSPLTLKNSPSFSGVSGLNIKVVGQKASTFDDENNIIVFEIEGKMANLEDFKIKNIAKQGAESSSLENPESRNMIYYVIIPKSVPLLEFEYFDIAKSGYEIIKIPNMPYDEKISTQSDISPKSSFELYKIAALLIMATIFFILLVARRRFVYFLLLFLPLGGIGYLLIPYENVILKKGGVMYILPTKNSTVFHISESDSSAKVLDERKEYLKIELEDGKIGWIKKEDAKKLISN